MGWHSLRATSVDSRVCFMGLTSFAFCERFESEWSWFSSFQDGLFTAKLQQWRRAGGSTGFCTGQGKNFWPSVAFPAPLEVQLHFLSINFPRDELDSRFFFDFLLRSSHRKGLAWMCLARKRKKIGQWCHKKNQYFDGQSSRSSNDDILSWMRLYNWYLLVFLDL